MTLTRIAAVLAAAGLLAATGTAAHATLSATGGGTADPFTGTTATELIAPTPSWYTDELHADAVAAAERGEGVAIPAGVDYPASGLAFAGIRPGAWIISPAGCTANFVFGTDGDYSIGTAGHCAEVGDEVTIIAAPGIVMAIGTTVTSVDNGVGDDFALIDIYPEMQQHVNPSMAHFGGPTGVGDPQFGDLVTHTGHGVVIGTGGTPRAGVVVYRGPGDEGPDSGEVSHSRGKDDKDGTNGKGNGNGGGPKGDNGTNGGGTADAYAWDGAASPGDSGSPVRHLEGEAAGDLTHIVVGGPYAPGLIAGTSIQRMLEIANKPLATAPNGPDPTA
ncbi:hypothetical protein [Haloechinothrix halophila]|uniref:hypothetical protein n=1 Tax=Haloechinothrix halophila TaxID=1069073 RepID=UPI000409AF5A|nr:hypothetical protein [Haloechinothrix halophila]